MNRQTQNTNPQRREPQQKQPYSIAHALLLAAITSILVSVVLLIGAISPETHTVKPSFHVLFVYGRNLVLLTILYIVCFRVNLRNLSKAANTTISIIGMITVTAVLSVGFYHLEEILYGETSNNFNITALSNFSAGITVFLVSRLIYNMLRFQKAQTENQRLLTENLRIRYNTLEQQVSPHFLFNSLNTLDGLIGTDDERAHGYLERLSSTYRYTLQQRGTVTLAEELEFTNAYIYMMQIRHGEALSIEEHISPALMQRQMPAISLQMLVENAIKHNVVSLRHPLCISITSVERSESDAAIRVSNPCHPKADNEKSAGIGLENLSGRYRMLFNRQITINDDGNTFAVEIPLV